MRRTSLCKLVSIVSFNRGEATGKRFDGLTSLVLRRCFQEMWLGYTYAIGMVLSSGCQAQGKKRYCSTFGCKRLEFDFSGVELVKSKDVSELLMNCLKIWIRTIFVSGQDFSISPQPTLEAFLRNTVAV